MYAKYVLSRNNSKKQIMRKMTQTLVIKFFRKALEYDRDGG